MTPPMQGGGIAKLGLRQQRSSTPALLVNSLRYGAMPIEALFTSAVIQETHPRLQIRPIPGDGGNSGSSESSTRVIVEPGGGWSHLGPASRQIGRCAWSGFQVSWRFRACRGWRTDSHW